MTKKRKQTQAPQGPLGAFSEGDLVGAKVKGHPLWPGYIEEVQIQNGKPKYKVRFFHTDDSGKTFIEIKRFADFTDSERNVKRKGFQEALQLCQNKFNELSQANKDQANTSPNRKKTKTNHEKTNDGIVEEQSLSIATSPQPSTSGSSSSPPSLELSESPKEEPSLKESPSSRDVHSPEGEEPPATSTQPSPESISSPQQVATNILANKIEKKVEKKTALAKKVKKVKVAKSKSSHTKNASCLRTPNKSTTSNNVLDKPQTPLAKEKNHSKLTSNKGEDQGENHYVDTDKIFKKLQEKIDKKLEEKEKLKEKIRHMKSINKASQKIISINEILHRFLQILKKVSSAKELEPLKKFWETSLESYTGIMPVLQKCTRIILDANNPLLLDFKTGDWSNLKVTHRKFHHLLMEIAANLKAADNNDRLPETIKEQAREAKKKMKDKFIKKFINEYELECDHKEIKIDEQPKRLNRR